MDKFDLEGKVAITHLAIVMHSLVTHNIVAMENVA